MRCSLGSKYVCECRGGWSWVSCVCVCVCELAVHRALCRFVEGRGYMRCSLGSKYVCECWGGWAWVSCVCECVCVCVCVCELAVHRALCRFVEGRGYVRCSLGSKYVCECWGGWAWVSCVCECVCVCVSMPYTEPCAGLWRGVIM